MDQIDWMRLSTGRHSVMHPCGDAAVKTRTM